MTEPSLVFGVLSDLHVRIAADGAGMAPGEGVETFRHALEWFRDRVVDAVAVPGDFTDDGLVEELEAVAAAWFRVFPDDRAPDGRRVERLFVCGNHDWNGWERDGRDRVSAIWPDERERRAHILQFHLAETWERLFREPFQPMWRKEVRGHSFVGAHWLGAPCQGSHLRDPEGGAGTAADPLRAYADETGVSGVRAFFDATGPFAPDRPFFYIHHPHLKDTCYGPWAWGHDDGEAGSVLAHFPNAVAFSGHSHYSLTDERSLWRGDFTSVGASSLSYVGIPFNARAPESYENSLAAPGWRPLFDPFKAMPQLDYRTSDGRQGMLVKVFPERIEIGRFEFCGDRRLGPDWVLPTVPAGHDPDSFAARAAREGAPAWPGGAVLSARREVGAIRGGTGPDGTAVPTAATGVWSLRFPAADPNRGPRAMEYEIEVRPASGGGPAVVKWLLAPGFYLPADDSKASADVEFRVAADRLPQDVPLRFAVTPVSSLGARGMPLCSSFSP